ncbi:class A beta-lactamase [Halomonas halocynthiae]|uniref:class A beta-lactamase n=1 Tax=Halomonas halocynthiae TaxID=176290 RepID=UPI0004217BE3|nr:class A beta-lactamase [Halomonas halocynthiae]
MAVSPLTHGKKILRTALSLCLLVLPITLYASDKNELINSVRQIEANLNARVGIAVYDLESKRNWQYHADDRFPLSSTFKTLACAALLQQADTGQQQLAQTVTFTESELVSYSPVTEAFVGTEGMTLSALCEATLSMSDNSAANFILDAIGGPQAVTQFARSIGDNVTRLDRWETELNEAIPGDERDTTTPNAMAMNLEKLVLGEALSPASRQQLKHWLTNNQVGDALFRASVPDDWTVADRTGAGGYGSRSIAALLWPPQRKPVVATLYITETEASFEDRNAAIAEIGAAIVTAVLTADAQD